MSEFLFLDPKQILGREMVKAPDGGPWEVSMEIRLLLSLFYGFPVGGEDTCRKKAE